MEVLLIEDNEADRRAVKEAFQAVSKDLHLHVSESADKVMERVCCLGEFLDAVRIDLILLDLNLPGASGYSILRELKIHPDTRKIPVIIFTSSTFQEDIKKCYELGANCYINKPMRYSELLKLATLLDEFWVKQVRYPS